MESKTNISKHSRHNSETTTLSTSKQKCVLNNSSVHKRSKSNCFNSSSIVSTTTTNTNGCGNYNCNNKAHIKTVVFNSDALKSNEQIINVSYKVDPEKYKLMRGKNCLKIFINFLEEGNSNNSNTKYNNVEVITTNGVIKSYQNMDNNYSQRRVNMNIDNMKSLNKSFKRSTSLYTKPVKITEDKKMDRKSIKKLNSELKKQNSIKKSPNRKKEPHMTGQTYGKDLLKKLSINNSNAQSQNNLLKNSISSFKRSKTNDDISNVVINNNINDNCDNSIEMNTIEVKSKNGYNNIFNTGKKVGSYIRNKMLQKTAENKKRMKLNDSFRRYMNTNSSNNNKTVHKINNYNNKNNNNNDSGIKYFSKTKKTLFPSNKYFGEVNNNEKEISGRINFTSNNNSPHNSFKKNTLYSNLLSDNLVIISDPEIIEHKRLNLSHGEFRRKSAFKMQNSFNLDNNTIDNNGKHHLYYSINTNKSDNIKRSIPKGKSMIISTNTSTPITTIGINKDECSIENTKNSYKNDNSKGYNKVRHEIGTKRSLNDTFDKEEIKNFEMENYEKSDTKSIPTTKIKNKKFDDNKNMENVYINRNGNVFEQQERKGDINENCFIKGKSGLLEVINNEERNVYCKYKEDNYTYGNMKENESQGVDDDRKSLNENTHIYNSSQPKEIPLTKDNAIKDNQEQIINYHLDTSSKQLYKSTKQFYPISPQINQTTTELLPSSTNHLQTLSKTDYSKEIQSQTNGNIPQFSSHSHRAHTQKLKTSPINPQESTNQMHLNLLNTQQQQSSLPENHQYNSKPHTQTIIPQQFQSQPDILKPSMISNTNQSIPTQTPINNNINNDNNPSLNNNISSTQFNNPSLTKQSPTQPISNNQSVFTHQAPPNIDGDSSTNNLKNNNTIINATTIPIDNEIPINKTNGSTNNIHTKPKSNSTPHCYKTNSQTSTIAKLRDISPLLVNNKKTQSIFNKKQKHLSFRLNNLSFLVKNKLAYQLSTNPSKNTTQQTQPQEIFYLRQKEIKSIQPPNAMIVDSVCFFK